MKKNLIYFVGSLTIVALAGCPSPSPSFEISKVWIVKTAKENGQLVYTRGASANLKNRYDQFRLDLSQPAKVLYKDLDEVLVTGTWQLSSDGQNLKLSNLVPVPTGTNGEINSLSAKIRRMSCLSSHVLRQALKQAVRSTSMN